MRERRDEEATEKTEREKSITFQATPPSRSVGQSRRARDTHPEAATRRRRHRHDGRGDGRWAAEATMTYGDAVTAMTNDLARAYYFTGGWRPPTDRGKQYRGTCRSTYSSCSYCVVATATRQIYGLSSNVRIFNQTFFSPQRYIFVITCEPFVATILNLLNI